MTQRRLSNWIDAFCEYTADYGSPAIFKKWAGISAVAGALERKVWAVTKKGQLFPNQYIFLVSPPGIGKTVLIDDVWQLWDSLEEHHVGSSSMTYASLIDELKESDRKVIRAQENPSYVTFNSLLIAINEIGVFLPMYDGELMHRLTDLYDCKHYTESRRKNDSRIKMKEVQLNMIAGGTPSYFRTTMPEGAWDQGFLARCMIVYSDEREYTDLFDIDSEQQIIDRHNGGLWADLKHDLQIIGKMYGQYVFSRDAAMRLNEWHTTGEKPKPHHPRLSHYCSRRASHVIKLAQIIAASSHDHLTVELDDLQCAFDWLVEVEHLMPNIFKAMASGGDAQVIDEAWDALWRKYVKDGVPVSEQFLYSFLSDRVTANSAFRIVEVMYKAGIIENALGDIKPKKRIDR